MTQAVPITVFSAQLDLLRKYCIVRIFSSYVQKTLNSSFVHLCAVWWGATSEAWNI